MTGPRPQYTDWIAQYGMGSPEWDRELAAFNAYRDSVWQSLLGQIAPQHFGPDQGFTYPQGEQQQSPPVSTLSDPDLIAAAKYWGFTEEQAASMPRNQLVAIVEGFRREQRPSEATAAQRLALIPHMLGGVAAEMVIGAGTAITGTLQHLPIIGESLSRVKALHDSDMWLREMDEAVRAHTPESFQWVNSTANIGGALVSMFYPATWSWKAAGLLGRAAPLAWAGKLLPSPLLRAGVQGAAAAVLMEGRGLLDPNDPEHQRAVRALEFGGALGVAGQAAYNFLQRYGPSLAAATKRVTSVFSRGQPGPQPDIAGELSGAVMTRPPAPQPFPMLPRRTPQQATVDQLLEMRGAASPEEQASIDAMVSQLNKAATVIESPALPQVASRAQIDEAAVGYAAHMNNPGGINIVEGIPDPVRFGQSILTQIPDAHIAFAKRPRSGRLDALISDQPLSPTQIHEYETYGMYNGQRTMTPGGIEAEILGIHGSMARIRPVNGGVDQFMPVEDLMPYLNSTASLEAPQLWASFRAYAEHRAAATGAAMGGALNPERLAQLRNESMPQYLDNFFDDIGMTDVGSRSRLKAYFNQQWVIENQQLDPEAAAFLSTVQERAAELNTTPLTPQRRLDSLAHSKGFVAVPTGDGQYVLVDGLGMGTNGAPNAGSTPTQISFTSKEGAEEWLRRFNRELPDITPATDVPAEVSGEFLNAHIQEPKLRNDRFEESASEAIDDVAETLGDTDGAFAWGEYARAQARQAVADGNWGKLQDIWGQALGRWRPSRARFARLESDLSQAGLKLDIFSDWDVISNARDLRHNWANPWHDRWTDIVKNFRREDLRNGVVTEIYEITDDAARLAAAQQAGFSPRQVDALGEMEQFFRDIFPEAGIDPAREIRRYISHVRARQSAGWDGARAYDMPTLSPDFSFFAEHTRTGNLNFREMDARELGSMYINALGFKKFMADDWSRVIGKWNSISREVPEIAPITNTFLNWARLIRHGYQPGTDASLSVLHAAMNVLVPGISKSEARQIFNMGLTTTHSALLGFRPDVWARDSIQLLLALPRAGMDLLSTFGRYIHGGVEGRSEIWDKAMQHGWVQLGLPRIAAPGVFEGGGAGLPPGALMPEGSDLAALVAESAQGTQSARYKLAQRVADTVWDALPAAAHNLQNTPFHPLYVYTKQGERMRLLVGYAGYQRAARSLAEYRAAGPAGSLDKLLGDSGARTYWPAVQERFKSMVATGADEEAAGFLGRQLADATQFRYGTPEIPEVARSSFGRMGMQMGNFGFQFWQYVSESLKNGTAADKAKFLMLMGGVSAALNAAARVTGWNFNKWQYANSLMFTGGPWLGVLADAYQGMSSVVQAANAAQAPNPTTSQTTINEAGGLGQAITSAASMFNPAAGLLRTGGGIADAFNSPDPMAALGRLFLTGERGPQPDVVRGLQQALPGPLNFPTGPSGTTPGGQLPYSIQPGDQSSPVPGGQPYSLRQSPFAGPPGLPPVGSQPPDPQMLQAYYGVSDPSRVYVKNGAWVYDSLIQSSDGRVATHRLDAAPFLLKPGQTWEELEQNLSSMPVAGFGPDTIRSTSVQTLTPEMRGRIAALQAKAAAEGVRLEVGETGRSQGRQNWIFAHGRNPDVGGNIATWTLTSAHGPGNAVDFIVNGDSTGRDPGYQWLWQNAPIFGLQSMGQMDPGHIYGTDSSFSAVPLKPSPVGAGAMF